MEKISALLQAVTIGVISLFSTQVNSLPIPTFENNPSNIISPEGTGKLEKTYGPFLEGESHNSASSVTLALPTTIPTPSPTAEPTIPKSAPTPNNLIQIQNPFPTKKVQAKPTPTPLRQGLAGQAINKTPTPARNASQREAGGPTPKPTLTPIPSPTPYVFSNSTNTTPLTSKLNPEYIFNKINEHRNSMGLAPFEKDQRLCDLAEARAPEIYDEIYGSGTMHAGLRNRQIPYWITENIATYNSEDAMINWWLNDYIHKIAIEGSYKYSCVACSGISCSQLFSSFIPK